MNEVKVFIWRKVEDGGLYPGDAFGVGSTAEEAREAVARSEMEYWTRQGLKGHADAAYMRTMEKLRGEPEEVNPPFGFWTVGIPK